MTDESVGHQYTLGAFRVHRSDSRVWVTHVQAPQRRLWSMDTLGASIQPGQGQAAISESRGFFDVKDKPVAWVDGSPVRTVDESTDGVRLSGSLGATQHWMMEFFVHDDVQLGLRVRSTDPEHNRIQISFDREDEDDVFGFGEQFTQLNMKGKRVPVLSQEPGIGRGVQPLTWLS